MVFLSVFTTHLACTCFERDHVAPTACTRPRRPGRGYGRPRTGRNGAGRSGARCGDETPKRTPNRILGACRTAVARQHGRRPPHIILAVRGSPSRWRGRPRVSSIIASELFLRQKLLAAPLLLLLLRPEMQCSDSCTYVHVYIHPCIHTHTHTHTRARSLSLSSARAHTHMHTHIHVLHQTQQHLHCVSAVSRHGHRHMESSS